MERYIDAELAKEALTGWETDPLDEEIERTIDNIPTADVAPKSEVAREIFEEIEKLIVRCYNDKWYVVPDLWCDVKMLKEKYTEEQI